jgi:hypothetical protein
MRILSSCLALWVLFAACPARADELDFWPAGGVVPANFAQVECCEPIVTMSDCGCGSSGSGSCGECDGCCTGCWWENTELFVGGDAYAGLGDFPAGGFGNSFGLVTGFNSGFALFGPGIRGQFGVSYGVYDFSGRGSGLDPESLEEQVFATTGLYRRADLCAGERISWGLVVDGFVADNWGVDSNELALAQLRGIAGYAVNDCNEFGVWATMALSEDTTPITGLGTPALRAMNQGNIYWKHNWAFGADTMLYAGALDNADVDDWVFGFLGRAPLSHSASLYGGFNYVNPPIANSPLGDALDAWNVNFGIVFFLGGKAVSPNVAGNQGLPLLPVANNGSFLITD